MKSRAIILPVLAVALWAGCRSAPGMPDRAPDITASDMRARISFLAADRLRGRGTPGRGLEIAASYIEAEFRRFGLQPAPGGFVQRYRLARAEMGGGWGLTLHRGSRRQVLRHQADFWGLPWAGGEVDGRLMFVGGEPPSEVDGAAAVWVTRLSPAVSLRQWLGAASSAGAVGILFVVPDDLRPQLSHRLREGQVAYELGDIEPNLPAALVSQEAMATALEGLGLEMLPAGDHQRATDLGARGRLTADLSVQTQSAPNVLAILPGRDARLREEYVLVSAHMDGLGVGPPVAGDSIYNGADDNASGTAAVLEVAEALASLPAPPRRSVAFLAVSGEERGLLGSAWFVEHPPIPLQRIVANLNVDMVGRNWEDTISVIGKPYSTLGTLVDSVAAERPELRLAVVGDLWPSEGFFFRSDHFNFARKGIPAVFFFNGVHEDYHQPSDEVDRIKFEKASRIAQLIYEVTVALANAEERPRWDPRIRRRIVEDSG